jgi:hypothetical protein
MLSLLGSLAREETNAETARDLAARFRRSCDDGRNAVQRDSIMGRLRLIASVLAEKDPSRAAAQWVGSIEDEFVATTEPARAAKPVSAGRPKSKPEAPPSRPE